MFYRNVKSAAELTLCCKPVLLQRTPSNIQHVSLQYRKPVLLQNIKSHTSNPGFNLLPSEAGPLNAKTLLKPFLFAVGVSSVSLAGCVIWEYEHLRSRTVSLLKRPGKWFNALKEKRIVSQFQYQKNEIGPITNWWNSLRKDEKVFYPILAANLLVFGAWRIRPLQPFMVKYFCSNPSGSAQCIPMILSTFSHFSPFHLAANMYVLYSFMPGAVAALGQEQFVAMYLSAGVISSFASFLHKVLLNQPGRSLGASGAIMAVLSYVCVQYPDTKLSIIFLPMFTFAAGTAIKFIMGFDFLGIVLGWKLFDHAAHLGGALFGLAWCYWGERQIWGNRDKVLKYYHNMRKDSGQ